MAGQQSKPTAFFVVRLLGEIGFIIAVPLVTLIFAGHWLDTRLGYKAVFIFVGMTMSLVLSSYIIYRKVKQLSM